MSKFLWVSGKTPDNVLEGIRTPDPRLRRPLLYPAELRTHIVMRFFITERVMGIEPTYPAWKAGVLPLNYTRIEVGVTGFEPATSWSQTRRSSQAEPHPVFFFRIRFCITRDARIIIWQTSYFVNNFFYFFQKTFFTPTKPLFLRLCGYFRHIKIKVFQKNLQNSS